MKKALVTGGSGGIGEAVCRKLAEDGYFVYIAYSSSEGKARKLAAEIGGEAVGFDVADSAAVKKAAVDIGALDLLVNNAGISEIDLFTSISEEKSSRIMSVNLIGAMNCARSVLPDMIYRKSGCIINISSMWGQCGASCEVDYSASKAGLIGFTKALAREAAPSGIRVNCISCGFIDTKMNGELSQSDRQAVIDEIAACRAGTPQDIANTVSFLADARSDYINGQVIRVDGCWI